MKIEIPRIGKKGFAVVNMLHLVIFYIIYFFMVLTAKYFMGVLQVTEPLSTYWEEIPSSAKMLMDLIIFIVIPIAALIWTILASRPEPEYVR